MSKPLLISSAIYWGLVILWAVSGYTHFTDLVTLGFPLLAVAWFVWLIRWLVGPRRVQVVPDTHR